MVVRAPPLSPPAGSSFGGRGPMGLRFLSPFFRVHLNHLEMTLLSVHLRVTVSEAEHLATHGRQAGGAHLLTCQVPARRHGPRLGIAPGGVGAERGRVWLGLLGMCLRGPGRWKDPPMTRPGRLLHVRLQALPSGPVFEGMSVGPFSWRRRHLLAVVLLIGAALPACAAFCTSGLWT